MDWLTMDELKRLLSLAPGPCVSLFMPTHRAGIDTRQDPIRLKNLVREAGERLQDGGLRSSEARALLEPAERLQDDPAFWRHLSDGLALFLTADVSFFYRLPIDFDEMVGVADRFHVKPLLPLFTGDGHFFILALSQNQVRLFEGTRYHLDELDLRDVPTSMGEALAYDDPEKHLQFHTRTARQTAGQPAIFYGHTPADDAKVRLLRYFQRVDAGLGTLLRGESSPLVVASVDYLLPIYREANSYPYLLDEGVVGSPEPLAPADLHTRAWAIVQPYFYETQSAAVSQYRQLVGSGKTSTDLSEVVLEAHYGRVETAFVVVGLERWGRFDSHTGEVDLCEGTRIGCEDLLDVIAVQTILGAGTVYAVTLDDMPDDGAVAAIYRY